ncbi:TRAP transporter substrate-binding protein [Chloroflexota bacterium]
MKNFLVVSLMLLLLIALILPSCAQPAPAPAPSPAPAPTPPPAPPKITTLRYTSALPIVHYSTDGMNMFADKVKAKTNGQVIIEVYPGGKLFKQTESPDAIRTGAVDIAMNSNDHVQGYLPVLSWTIYSYMTLTAEQFHKIMPKLREIDAPLFKEKLNAKFLYYNRYTDLGINSKTPIKSPSDLKGLRVRVPTGVFADNVSLWGGNPQSMSSSEVYNALSKGTLDACLTSSATVTSRKFYEVAKYFVKPISWSYYEVYMNLDSWNTLSKENQAAIEEVIKELEPITWKQITDDMASSDKFLKDNITLYDLSPAEVKQWGNLALGAYDKFKADMATKGYAEQLKQIEQLVSSAR